MPPHAAMIHQSIALVYILSGEDVGFRKKHGPIRPGDSIRIWRRFSIGYQAAQEKPAHCDNKTDDCSSFQSVCRHCPLPLLSGTVVLAIQPLCIEAMRSDQISQCGLAGFKAEFRDVEPEIPSWIHNRFQPEQWLCDLPRSRQIVRTKPLSSAGSSLAIF